MEKVAQQPCESIATLIVSEIEAVFAALVGGAKYGMKIRFPHAFVMTFLFRRDLPLQDKIRGVLKLSIHHAKNLACFAGVYKILITSLKWISRHLRQCEADEKEDVLKSIGRTILSLVVDGPYWKTPVSPSPAAPGHPETSYHSLVAGTISGYVVWKDYSSINYQILLYVASRVVIALFKKTFLIKADGKTPRKTPPIAYSIISSLAWGLAIALYEDSPHVLHRSMKTSMDEIYRYGVSPTKYGSTPNHSIHSFMMDAINGVTHPHENGYEAHGCGHMPIVKPSATHLRSNGPYAK